MIEITKTQENLRKILSTQKFGVFSSSRYETPHITIVSFASSDDLTKLYYVTPRSTRKIINAQIFPKVSILVDTRTNDGSDIKDAVAIAAVGVAKLIESEKKSLYKDIFLGKHPYLDFFFNSPSTDLIEISVDRYQYVSNFQNVLNWYPPNENNPKGRLEIRQKVGVSNSIGYYRGKISIVDENKTNTKKFVENILVFKNKPKNLDKLSENCSGILIEEPLDSSTPKVKGKIPIVSGIPNLLEIVKDGENATVDGHLGIAIFHGVK